MKIKTNYIKTMTIDDFADLHNLTLEIDERRNPDSYEETYYASFQNCEIHKDELYTASFGNGKTPTEAVIAYANKIQKQTLIYENYNGGKRKVIEVPYIVCKLESYG